MHDSAVHTVRQALGELVPPTNELIPVRRAWRWLFGFVLLGALLLGTRGLAETTPAGARGAKYAASAAQLSNEFPVVTHWSQALHNGRGGPEVGATDRLGTLTFDKKGTIVSEMKILDSDPKTPYAYATDRYALFSGDPLAPDAKVPGYERYVGEDYSIFSLDEDFLSRLDGQILTATGYPVIHRNGGAGLLSTKLEKHVPAFQVLHASIFAVEPDKSSLATIILPPGWAPREQPYPVLFYGYYDIHETFARFAPSAMQTTANLLRDFGKGVITVLWNGGGSFGPIAVHRSAYDNVALLMNRLREELGADTQRVVTVGCSRGGSTALAVAANPYHDNYTVKYALAYSPGSVRLGERTTVFRTPTHPGYLSVLANFLGYKYSWKRDWLDPEFGLSNGTRGLMNYLGVSDAVRADELSSGGDLHLRALREKGTRVVLNIGTHDAFQAFPPHIEFRDRLRRNGIPHQLHIAYRFGHCGVRQMDRGAEQALRWILLPEQDFQEAVFYYRRKSEEEWKDGVRFSPAVPPVFLEAPRILVPSHGLLLTLGGAAGARYRVTIRKLDERAFAAAAKARRGARVLVLEGKLTAQEGSEIGSALVRTDWPAAAGPGRYLYQLQYRLSDREPWQEGTRTPGIDGGKGPAVLQVLEHEPDVDGVTYFKELAVEGRGWGLSSE